MSRRSKCQICKTGKGCRTRGTHRLELCPICGHWCRSHQPAYLDIIPAYCFWPKGRCDCPGWPVAEKKTKPRKSKENHEYAIITT